MAIIDLLAFREREAQGLITCRPHPTHDLLIWNYTPRCQFERAWDEVTMQARGLITTGNGTIVARPFKKFHNVEEVKELPLELFKVTEKMDGSLGILYFSDGKPSIATRGSFTSEQAVKGTQILREKYSAFQFRPHYTYLFEIVFKSNRIVVDYGDMEDIILLAVIETETAEELDIHAPSRMRSWPFPVVRHYDGITDIGALKQLEEANKEGFVLRFESGLRVKAKFEQYKKLHAILTRTSTLTLWETLATGQDIASLFEQVPDEFAGWVRKIASELTSAKDAWIEMAMVEFANMPQATDRKTFALVAVKSPMKAALFHLLDGRSINEMAWRAVKPEYARPFCIDDG